MSEIRAIPVKDFVSGSIAGIVSVILGQPLETVKVRMQSQHNLYSSTKDCIKKMYTKEGLISFYKGLVSPLFGISFCFGVTFAANSFSKNYLKKRNTKSNKSYQLTQQQFFYCGLFTGLCTSFLNFPIEYIRIILQVQGADAKNSLQYAKERYTGSLDALKKICKSKGIVGLYTGLSATILRDVPGGGIYFGVLENLMRKGEKQYTCRSNIPSSVIMMSGSIAGIISTLIIFPIDVVKSIIQANTSNNPKYRHVLSTIRAIHQDKGYKGFLNGLSPCIARSLPISAIAFLTFEKSSNYLKTCM